MRDVMFGTLAPLAYVVRFPSALFYAVGLAIGIMVPSMCQSWLARLPSA